MTDLTKMVEEACSKLNYLSDLPSILSAMAAEIEAMREEIKKLKVKTKYMR